jgi:hypothetical protein
MKGRISLSTSNVIAPAIDTLGSSEELLGREMRALAYMNSTMNLAFKQIRDAEVNMRAKQYPERCFE